jgi:hypothetical protein
MTEIIRAESGADLLALVPALLGYRPRQSVALVAFQGRRTGGGMRLDLPRGRRAADHRAVADAAVSMLSRLPGVDRVVPVVYTDATFTAEKGSPRRDLARVVIDRLRAAGFDVTEAFCVAADGWGSYLDDGAVRPLEAIGARGTGRLAEQARSGRVDELSARGRLPRRDGARARQIEEQAARIERYLDELEQWRDAGEDGADPRLDDADAFLDEVDLVLAAESGEAVERALALGWRFLAPLGAAWLLGLFDSPPQRDAVMLQVAFGEAVGYAARVDQERWSELQRERGLPMDDLVAAERDAGTLGDLDLFSAMLLGRVDERPDPERIARGIALVEQLAAHAPASRRAPLLTVLAWWWWCLGLASVAGRLLDQALRLDPALGMARLLHTVVGSGALPAWAFAQPLLDAAALTAPSPAVTPREPARAPAAPGTRRAPTPPGR